MQSAPVEYRRALRAGVWLQPMRHLIIEQEIPLSVDEWRRERILYRWAQNLFDPSLIRIPEPMAPRPPFGLPELTVAV